MTDVGRSARADGTGSGEGVIHGDPIALALAISPLALSMPALWCGTFASLSVVPALVSVQAVFMLMDRRSLEACGSPSATLPSPALYLLPGAYLADRARALGRSDDLVWTWIFTMLHSIAILAFAAAMLTRAAGANVHPVARTGPILVDVRVRVEGTGGRMAPRRLPSGLWSGVVVRGVWSPNWAEPRDPGNAVAGQPGG